MTHEQHSRVYLWLGAGTLALGIGAALASASGVAQADSTSSSSPGPAKPGHHQAAASPSHSAASPVKASAKKKSSGSHLAVAKPGIVSSAVDLHVAKADKATATADNPIALQQALATQSQAIVVQGQQIAAQGQAIANEEKTFGTQTQNFMTTTNFIAVPTRGLVTEFYYGVSAGTLLEFGQWTNGIASGLNGVAQNITALETGIISRTEPGSSLAIAAYSALTPITNFVTTQANGLAAASAKFYVTAGAYEAGFIQNLPQQYGTTVV
jgi:hypothetical protein